MSWSLIGMGWVRRWDGGGDDDDDDANGYVGMIDGVLDGVSLGVLPGWVLFFPGPVDFDLDLLPLLALPVLVLLLPLHPPLLLLLLPLHHHPHLLLLHHLLLLQVHRQLVVVVVQRWKCWVDDPMPW